MGVQKYAAELLATGVLTLTVTLSLTQPASLPTPLVAALTLGMFVYVIGEVSGAHLNPAVTVGLWSARVLSLPRAIGYILAQVLGALLAQRLAFLLTGATPQVTAGTTSLVGVGELTGTFLLVFVVSAVVAGKVPAAASGLAIGTALLLGILVASTVSSGILNPAVAVGLRAVSPMTILAPLAGGILGAQVSRWLTRS